jgi:glycosyltransferase involved in cell wall biosynthesis
MRDAAPSSFQHRKKGDAILLKKRKLLFVGNDVRYFILHRLALAESAVREGYEVHAALPAGGGMDRIRAAGIQIHQVPLKRGGIHLRWDVAIGIALYRLYRNLRPDIVHLHTIKPVIYGGLMARLARQPVVVCGITGLGYMFVAKGFWGAILRWLASAAYRISLRQVRSCVIFQNDDDRKMFVSKGISDVAGSVVIKGSGVDLGKYYAKGEPAGMFTIMLVSRMLWDKGIGEFVEASQLLRKRGVEVKCVLVGDVDEANPGSLSREQLRQWHETGMVEWWGWIEDVASVYESAHVVCLPSRYGEGVPRSLIEAAACGKPIVTTDAPGCREIVRDGENGYLVPRGDAIALADALERLLSNENLRKAMGERSRRIAETEFSSERVIQETLNVYRNLLQ